MRVRCQIALAIIATTANVTDADTLGRSHRRALGSRRMRLRHMHARCADAPSIRCSNGSGMMLPLALSLQPTARLLRMPSLARSGATNLDEQHLHYLAARPDAAATQAFGFGLRATLTLEGMHLGVEAEIGSAISRIPVQAMSVGAAPLSASQGGYSAGFGLLGAKHRLGVVDVAAEIAAGVITMPVAARFIGDRDPDHVVTLTHAIRATAELRIRVSTWLTPWFSAGTFIATDVVGRGFASGVSLDVHVRAFDGAD